MGHIVEEAEVEAVDAQLGKTATTTAQSTASLHGPTPSHPITSAPLNSPADIVTEQANTREDSNEVGTKAPHDNIVSGSQMVRASHGLSQKNLVRLRPSHSSHIQPQDHRQRYSHQQQKPQIQDESSPEKKLKEKSDDDSDEEEIGSWADGVVAALNGTGTYSDAWHRSHNHLILGDGPLPHTWRLYVAMLAVCRHEVVWLMQALISDFRAAGGDVRWTTGLHHAPRKLYALASINNLLAHRPWLLTPGHIQKLTKGSDSWSLGELCQALCILTHFHTLASFLHGCGLASFKPPPKLHTHIGDARSRATVTSISECVIGPQDRPKAVASNNNNNSSSNNNNNAVKKVSILTANSNQTRHNFPHLTIDPSYGYVNFICNDESQSPSLSVQDYNWQDHGYAMCSRLVGEAGTLLDERFSTAVSWSSQSCQEHPAKTSLTDQQAASVCRSIPREKVAVGSSSLPRKALWNYVQWLLGIHHDDCDYADLNDCLEPHIKTFVKNVCCFPQSCQDMNSCSKSTTWTHPQLVEASVIVMEARLQSELLYALRAIMLHQC